MGDKTGIQWTDSTWNPITGCTKVSPGCAHCYAERVFPRAYGRQWVSAPGCLSVEGGPDTRVRRFTDIVCHEDRLEQPLHWRKPRKIFVNSMSDLFHEDVPFSFIDKVFAVMAECPQHTFQVLTKRVDRMIEYCDFGHPGNKRIIDIRQATAPFMSSVADRTRPFSFPLPNVWLGVSVEDQKRANERISILLRTPAVIRFASYEPALGPINFRAIGVPSPHPGGIKERDQVLYWNALDGFRATSMCSGTENNPRLDWIIVGGESGAKARPFDVQWARQTIEQCRTDGTACFVKQLGANPTNWQFPNLPDSDVARLKDSHGGDWAEWPEDLRVRQFPVSANSQAIK